MHACVSDPAHPALHRDLAWQLGESDRPFFDTHAPEDLGAYLHDYRRDLLVWNAEHLPSACCMPAPLCTQPHCVPRL